eukprot:jgi/Psemu1/306645/fgenesh1_kg.270_\
MRCQKNIPAIGVFYVYCNKHSPDPKFLRTGAMLSNQTISPCFEVSSPSLFAGIKLLQFPGDRLSE